MKLLATAKPNKRYRWHKNIDFIILQARMKHKIRYYEIANGRENCISENLVKLLFPNGMIKDRPFLAKENKDFYAILNRNRKQYQETSDQLKRKKIGFVRTKFKNK